MANILVSSTARLCRNPMTMTRFNLDGSLFIFLSGRDQPLMLKGRLARLWQNLDFPMEFSRILKLFSKDLAVVEQDVLKLLQMELLIEEK